MKIRNIFGVTLLSAMLSGCGLYPKFDKSVELEVPDSLYSYIEATSDTTSNIATIGWREFFEDGKLQSLIELGLENNTDLNIARLNVEQAEVALKSARLAYTPTLSVGVDGALKNVAGTTTTSYTLGAYASWEVDVFGKLTSAKRESKAALEQSVAYAKAVQTQLISSIAINYYTLIMLDEQLKISEKTLVMWENNIRTMEGLYRAGRTENTSVLQSKASHKALESSIVSIKESIQIAENNLSVLLKITPQHISRSESLGLCSADKLSVGVPLELLANRPDVQVAEYSLMQAFYAVGVARASLYPSISLTGAITYSDGSGIVTNPKDVISNLAGSILQPIFNRRTLRASLEVSKMQQEQAMLTFNQTVLDAGAEVNTSLLECRSAQERVEFEMSRIEYLEGAVRSSELMMTHGTSSYLEVLVAQQSLLSAQLSFATTLFEQRQGAVNLYRSLGGGIR